MLTCARGIGGAGTGKTRMMMETLEKALLRPEVGGNPRKIAFSSMTRAARQEASSRASVITGVPQGDLERNAWFKTCHAVAYKQLGVERGEIIGGGREDSVWVSNAVGSDVAACFDDDESVNVYTGDPVAAGALNYWNLARAMVVPLRDVVESDNSADALGFAEVLKRVEMYESAKRLDGRIDFTDMLARFAGVSFSPSLGPEHVSPDGEVPDEVVGWIFDEAQDASRLIDLVCRRLVTGESCKWAWLVGDPFQVLYSWSGASAKWFMSWDVAKEHTMQKSYRCAAPILALGERQLRRMSEGYWDRKIAPADHDGLLEEYEMFEEALEDIDPSVETLVVARLNRQVRQISAILNDAGVPYRRVKCKEGMYQRDLGMTGLWKLQHGQAIEAAEWTQVLDILPSRGIDGQVWLVRGAKARWKADLSSRYDLIFPDEIGDLGASEGLQQAIRSGAWSGLPDGGTKWARAAKKHGIEAVSNPKVRIGTVHSVKGQEADKVIVLSSVGRRVRESEEEATWRHNEERRIEYVAATRARSHLVIAHDPRERFRMEFEI